MSVDQMPPGKARSASREPQLVRYGEYVDQQIESTRKLVKFVDAMTVLLTIAVGTILFLLTAAVVEHWLVPSGYNFAVRTLLFLLLVGSIGYFAVRRLWPLCVSSINPAYAAQAIEHDNPALKNSLLNLLLFRQNREQVTDAVYETLEEQAAKRLTRVPVESAVDRTQLLRLAYVLMVIVAIAAIYKIFSPKDPFVTAERVLLPWANVVPASRVSIENVEPGHVTLARGDVLNVSADVRGIGDDDPVIVKFTTADGQAVDRPAAMTPSVAGLRFTGQIPPAEDASRTGVAQNLRYRIEAGDARSLEYSVTVIAAPTITIDRIDYDYPDYTRLADRSVERQGHISAIEGTRVTIYARANQQIKEASLDFEADGRRDATLQVDGTNARTGFELALRDDRRTPKFTSYVLRFTDVEGRSNRNPVKYPIEVEPDVAPETSVLAPKEKSRDVRLDETITIEVDAIDSDYGLAEVRIHGEAAGRTVIDEKPLSKHHTGRFTGRVRFTPIDHSLKPGDVVRYWVTARDDRPNETASDSQTLRITSPDPNQPGPDRLAQRDEPKPNDESQQDSDQQGEAGDSGESGGAGAADSSQGKQGEQQGESASADGQNGQPSEQNPNNQPGNQQSDEPSDQPGEQGNSQSSEGQSGSNESDGNQSGEQQGTEGQSGGNQSGSSEQQGEQQGEQNSEAQQQPGNSSDGASGNSGSQNNSQQPSAGEQPGNESGQRGANNNSQQRPNPNRQPNGNQQNNGEQQPGEFDAPVSSEGDNDGEAFERIQNFLERDGKLPEKDEANEQNSQDSPQGSEGESASADGQSGDNSQQQSPSDSNSEQGTDSEKGTAPADGPGAQTNPGDNPEELKDPADGKQSENSESPGGQQTSSKGESGAGEESQQNQGSPDSQPTTKPTDKPSDKWEQKPSGDKQGEQEPSAGGRGKQESDSQGNEGGDHTGGGEEGGGQKANRDGTGSSGQNQSADEGAGESSEKGQGNTSSNAGEDAKSESPTGVSSKNQSGDGSSQRDGTGNQQGGESPNENNPGEPASAGGQEGANKQSTPNNQPDDPQQNQQNEDNSDQSNSQEQPNNQPGAGDQSKSAQGDKNAPSRPDDSQSAQNSGSDAMSGAGRPPQGVIPPSKTDGAAPAADDANLDYARKRTDLVLETLAEQMKRRQVDKRLLDELGWTEADMKRFLDRWQQLKAAAQNDATADDAQRELDDALRSLGLRRGALQQSKVSDDTDRDLRQGFRGPVPQEYQDRLKAYNQGVSRAREQGRE